MANKSLQEKWGKEWDDLLRKPTAAKEWDDLLSKSTAGDVCYSHTEVVLFDQCDLVEILEEYLGLNEDKEVKVRIKARDGYIAIERVMG